LNFDKKKTKVDFLKFYENKGYEPP